MKAQIAAKYIQFLSNKKANKNSGFTLIELLVVIIIIGILSAIALPSFLNQAAKARASEARTNVGAMNRAQQAYYLESQTFVASPTTGGVPTQLGLGINSTDNYIYKSTAATPTTSVVNYGTPATGKTDLKAYSGGVFKTTDASNNTVTASILCEALTPAVADATAPTDATTCVAASTKKLN